MFQLSFLNTGLLIFAAATILPLLIWLLAKRKPKRMVFSSLRFIKLSKDQEKKRSRLKNILLLIIRMLIILLAVLAVARPSLRSPRLRRSQKHPPTALAVILDSSYSMDYLEGGKTLLEKAKQILEQINAKATRDDRLILITSDEAFNSLHSQIFAGEIPGDIISRLEITHAPLAPESLLKLAERKLAETQMTNREIVLITDKQAQEYPEKPFLPVQVIGVTPGEGYSNLAASDARPLPQVVDRRRSQVIEFKLSNYGETAREEVLVAAVVNGIKLAEKFVSLPPRETQVETITVELASDGWQSGYIEVLDERLTQDNRAYFAFPFYLNPRVAVISEASALPPALASILSVYMGAQARPSLLHPASFSLAELKGYNLIVLGELSSINPRIRDLLREAETGNQGILYSPGRNLGGDYKALLEQTFGLQISGFQTTETATDFINPHHHISSLVAARSSRLNPVRDYHKARSTGASGVLLSAGGDALVLSRGKGVLWLWDLHSLQNRFLLDPAFPVLALRSIEYISGSNPELSKLSLGDRISAGAISLPGGQRLELAGRSYFPSMPGIYSVHGASDYQLAIDPDYGEGDYKAMDYAKLKQYKELDENWQIEIFQSRLGHEIWKYLLLAALLLMLLEIILVKLEEARPRQES